MNIIHELFFQVIVVECLHMFISAYCNSIVFMKFHVLIICHVKCFPYRLNILMLLYSCDEIDVLYSFCWRICGEGEKEEVYVAIKWIYKCMCTYIIFSSMCLICMNICEIIKWSWSESEVMRGLKIYTSEGIRGSGSIRRHMKNGRHKCGDTMRHQRIFMCFALIY